MPFYDAIPVDYIAPGKFITVQVDGFPVAIANVDGNYHAFQNLCPHQGTTLGGRPVKDCLITCYQHDSNRPAEMRWNRRFATVIRGGMAGRGLIFRDFSCRSMLASWRANRPAIRASDESCKASAMSSRNAGW